VIAYVTGIGAARALGPKVSSFVGLSEVLFAVMFAWILLGQVPAPVQFVGGVFMLAGVALVRVDDLYSERDFSGSEPRAANSGK
jgi:drug/metabolite transporter (DMT)-like permease